MFSERPAEADDRAVGGALATKREVRKLRYMLQHKDQTDEIQKFVKLIFAEQDDGIATYRESEINEYGGMSEDWPDGLLGISAKTPKTWFAMACGSGGAVIPGQARRTRSHSEGTKESRVTGGR